MERFSPGAVVRTRNPEPSRIPWYSEKWECVQNGISIKTQPDKGYQRLCISPGDTRISIDFHVIVSYGVSISTVADNLIENVKYKVEEFTGMPVEKINIYVEGVRVID